MFPPNAVFPLSGGCSDGLDEFNCFSKQSQYSAVNAMNIIVDPLLPLPTDDSVLPLCHHVPSLFHFHRENFVVALHLYPYYITYNYYLVFAP